MSIRDLLAALAAGQAPGPEDLRRAAAAIGSGEMSDAQVGAFAMGVRRCPLSSVARAALTEGMRDSGEILTWDLPGPVLDKHSTGGIGDAVSLVLAPALAAVGAFVPMISGRGLGHSGGTLDKLEAIPGFVTGLEGARLRAVVAEVGCAIVGASARVAPADRRLYAVRDVTGTVDSLDLITASILSKKLAAGLDALVLDVKVGSGAFMKTEAAARDLAEALVDTGRAAGCAMAALISDMSQPLIPVAGNALEVRAAVDCLRTPHRGAPLADLSAALGGRVLALGGMARDTEAGVAAIWDALDSGAAAERFARMVAAQGGPTDLMDRAAALLPQAPQRVPVWPDAPGVVAAVDTEALGWIVVDLGGGRRRESDRIDPRVGLAEIARVGEEVGPDRPLALIHAASDPGAMAARLRAAFTLGDAPVAGPPLLRGAVA